MITQFKILDLAYATNDIGNQYPQIQEMIPGYNYDADDSVYQLSNYYDSIPDINPKLNFVLHRGAKPTDFLSSVFAPTGFIVNKKIRDLLSQFNLPNHKWYTASVMHHNELVPGYDLLHIVHDTRKYVNYLESEFFIYQEFSRNHGSIEILSEQDFLEKNATLTINDPSLRIWASKLHFNKDFPSTLDLFSLTTFNADTFISDRLHQALVDNMVSGIDIKSTDIFG